MPPRLFLPPLECWRGVSPIQAPNCAPFLNCLKSPTRGHHRRGTDRADADQAWPPPCTAGLSLRVCGDALVAPGAGARRARATAPARAAAPAVPGCSVRCSASSSTSLKHAPAARAGLCANTRPNSASRPRMRLMQAVRSSLSPSRRRCTHSMLCCSTRLDRHEAHLRARGGLADRRGVVGVVLAARALAAVRADQLRRDDARVQAQRRELARPVVRARAGLHRHHAAGRQLRAPGDELARVAARGSSAPCPPHRPRAPGSLAWPGRRPRAPLHRTSSLV